jgi:hypothetical protein
MVFLLELQRSSSLQTPKAIGVPKHDAIPAAILKKSTAEEVIAGNHGKNRSAGEPRRKSRYRIRSGSEID